jgi:uncharacterized membrane protein (DUF485 family)
MSTNLPINVSKEKTVLCRDNKIIITLLTLITLMAIMILILIIKYKKYYLLTFNYNNAFIETI